MVNEVSKIYSDIAELLNIARAKAYHTVNSIMVETYWKIGQRIVEETVARILSAEARAVASAEVSIAARVEASAEPEALLPVSFPLRRGRSP